MAGVNKVILVGNLGRDPEVRTIPNGAKVATFSIATSESWTDKNTNEKKEITDWHNIVLWRGLAEIAERYLRKGSQVYIEGKLKTRSWQDDAGNTRYTTEVIGDNMTMLGRREGGSPGNQAPLPTEEPTQSSSSMSQQASKPLNQQTATNPMTNTSPAASSAAAEEDDLPF